MPPTVNYGNKTNSVNPTFEVEFLIWHSLSEQFTLKVRQVENSNYFV